MAEEEYLDILEKKAILLFKRYKVLIKASIDQNVDLNGCSEKTVWEMLESISYDANDECRRIQREANPALAKKYGWDFELTDVTKELEIKD